MRLQPHKKTSLPRRLVFNPPPLQKKKHFPLPPPLPKRLILFWSPEKGSGKLRLHVPKVQPPRSRAHGRTDNVRPRHLQRRSPSHSAVAEALRADYRHPVFPTRHTKLRLCGPELAVRHLPRPVGSPELPLQRAQDSPLESQGHLEGRGRQERALHPVAEAVGDEG